MKNGIVGVLNKIVNKITMIENKYHPIVDRICIDCGNYRRQKLKGERNDGTIFYICEICGCENDFKQEECLIETGER